MTDYGHPCGKDQDCTLPNIHCAYPNCYKGKQQATQTTDADIDRAITIVRNTPHGVDLSSSETMDRAIYRAGFAAGIEAAAKVCEKRPIRSGKVAAAAIRALKDAS